MADAIVRARNSRPVGVVIDHLRATGDQFATLIRRLSDADLEVGEGRVGRLAIIAAPTPSTTLRRSRQRWRWGRRLLCSRGARVPG
jgi:hypothetical protein